MDEILAKVIVFFIFTALIPFALTISKIFIRIGWQRRLAILLNLVVWGYEIFFFVVACEGVPHLSIHFGGGLGDLLYFFVLVLLIPAHIIILCILTYKALPVDWFVIFAPLAPVCLLLAGMHLSAARGNEENGYMIAGNCAGLYYDADAHYERLLRQRELEEAEKPKKPEFATQFESYLYDAEHGYLKAQNHVARCYALGDGVEQNDSLAIKWYRLAAEGGYAVSQVNLGACYYNGSCGFEVDYTEAVKWFRKAAEQGDDYAQYLMGRCYGNGKGVEQDDEEAFKWLRLAARQGNEQAQELLRENKQKW